MPKPNVGALLDAIAECDDAKVQACLDSGVSVNGSSNFANTPMHYAAFKGNAKYVHLFARIGADIESVNEMRRTPVHVAAKELKLDSLVALVDLGARIDVLDRDGKTPKDLALERKLADSAEIVAFLDAATARQAIAKVKALAVHREATNALSLNP